MYPGEALFDEMDRIGIPAGSSNLGWRDSAPSEQTADQCLADVSRANYSDVL
jgi:hypothetical protein